MSKVQQKLFSCGRNGQVDRAQTAHDAAETVNQKLSTTPFCSVAVYKVHCNRKDQVQRRLSKV